jgi:CheY-like chemotaxis protein
MSEGAAGTASGYGRLIEEVFIDPIRTVVVVDDEFPTLDALLDKELGNPDRSWKPENAKRAQEIIRFCRDDKRRWLVEIHDGKPPTSIAAESEAASHLHQSDLMILDFHLDEKRPNDGGDAIRILRRLADNDHFNLVVVYTKGTGETGGDIPRIVREIALGVCRTYLKIGLIFGKIAANSIS